MWKGRYRCAVTLSVDFDAETLWSGTLKLVTPSRRQGSVLRFVPPFSTTEEQIDRAAEMLDLALTEARATAPAPVVG
jgi:acetylornithine/succinyldiaminopimelate/putrescine aminotransferase